MREIGAKYAWIVTVAPTVEPITVDEVKLFARIDTTEEDSLISSLISSARQQCELFINRALISQTLELRFDYWLERVVDLPRSNLLSITSAEYVDESGIATAIDSNSYYAITNATPGKFVVKKDYALPSQTLADYGGYKITYKAGYGTAAANVPSAIKDALKFWVTKSFEDRSLTSKPPEEVLQALKPYRVLRIGT